MSVRIRLRRVGRKKQPSYRVVVATSTTPRGGEYLETVGFYNPRGKSAELRIDLERVDEWLGKGAEMTDTAASLIKKARKGSADGMTIRVESANAAHEADVAAKKAASAARTPAANAAPAAVTEAPAATEAAAATEAPAETEAAAETEAPAEETAAPADETEEPAAG